MQIDDRMRVLRVGGQHWTFCYYLRFHVRFGLRVVRFASSKLHHSKESILFLPANTARNSHNEAEQVVACTTMFIR